MEFNNINIINFVFKSFLLSNIKQHFQNIKNMPLSKLMLKLLSYKNIFKSLGSNKVELGGFDNKAIVLITLLQDGNIVSALDDNTLNIWDTKSQKLIKTITAENTSVLNSLLILPDNKIATGFFEGIIAVYNAVNDYKLLKTIITEFYIQFMKLLSNDKLACIGWVKKTAFIKIYDLNDSYKILKVIENQNCMTSSLIYMDNYLFAYGNYSPLNVSNKAYSIRIWDFNSNMCVKVLAIFIEKLVLALLFIKKQNLLLSRFGNGVIMVWDVIGYECIKVIELQQELLSFILLPNGYFASAGKEIKIWDIKDFTCVNTLNGNNTRSIKSILLMPDKRIAELMFFIWEY
jgi:WD40 repeat protein